MPEKPAQSTASASSTSPSKAGLRPAGEASDPEVHRLLAELESARLNDSDDGIKEISRKLADLGYSAG